MRHGANLPGLRAGAALAVVYFLGGALGLGLARIHPSVSAVWPPTGIAIAGLLLRGYGCWPAIALGAFAVNLTFSGAVLPSAGIAAGNTLEALAATWLTNRFAGGRACIDRPLPFFVFLVQGALASTTISATIGVACLFAAGSVPADRFEDVWTTWWLGDLIGAATFAPLVLAWAVRGVPWTRTQLVEAAILFAGLVVVTWIAFGPLFFGEQVHPRTFLTLPFLIWAGFRFHPRVAATATVLLSVITTWCTVDGVGPFARLPEHDALLMLQIYVGFMGAVALTVALTANESRARAQALLEASRVLERRVQERTHNLVEANEVLAHEIGERADAQRELGDSEARFRELVERAPDAIVIVDAAGRIEVVNAQTESFFGYPRAELLGQPVEMLVPERFRERHVADRASFLANPHVRTMGEGRELFGRRKDGSEFPIDISLSPLETRDGPAVTASIRDTTKRRQWERERFANESLRSQVAELSRRTKEIATLNRMSDLLRSVASPAEAYPLVTPFLEEMFPANSGAMYVFDEGRTRLTAVARWGTAPPDDAPIAPDDCWALRQGRAHCLLPNVAAPVCAHLPSPPPTVSMCIPMVAKAEMLGLFHLLRPAAVPGEHTAPPAEYSEYKQKLAHAVAEQVAGAIANASLHEKLRIQAIRDPLTGLLNRRSLEESLAHELHRAQRRESKVGVLMLDLDHFKKWNDRHGHAAGDEVLRAIARFLGQCTRKEDIVCRYGGEEITVVLADCSPANLRRRAEQICRGVRGVKIELDGKPLGSVTVSVGAALYPDHGSTPDELLRAADQALYRAKAAGRDRVEMAADAPADASARARAVQSRAKR